MTAWRLRPMRPADLPQIARLEQELFGAEAWSQELLTAELAAAAGVRGPVDRRYLVAEAAATAAETVQASGRPDDGAGPDDDAGPDGREGQGPGSGVVVGYAGVWTGDGQGEADLLTIATVPEHRRQGVARSLLEAAVACARAAGCPALLLEVRESNTAAQRLYLGRGFKPLGRRRRYYTAPVEDALVMRLNL
ncbi:GNAT family N-acetyltransferase [Actinomyces weissii]|nr:GNAT family N-acetyltransferase [Actinomyces weissii]